MTIPTEQQNAVRDLSDRAAKVLRAEVETAPSATLRLASEIRSSARLAMCAEHGLQPDISDVLNCEDVVKRNPKEPDYMITPARYAKGKMIIRPTSDGSGYKTRAARLAEAKGIGGRWVNRSGGYTVSPTAARKFEKLYAEGWDASFITGELEPPRQVDA